MYHNDDDDGDDDKLYFSVQSSSWPCIKLLLLISNFCNLCKITLS